MSSRKNIELFEAICFFNKKNIIKEMRYSEFEAILDGVVGIPEFSNKTLKAAYVKISHSLTVHSIVTFSIEFNERGFADEDWNIPLRHLAGNAGPGPDLGAGPVRLACRSQCSVSWYQRELWEPNQDSINHFILIRDAVKRNKLGLIVNSANFDDIPTLLVSSDGQPSVPLVSDKIDVSAAAVSSKLDVNVRLEAQAKEYQAQVDKLIQRQKQTLYMLDEKYKEEIDQVKRAMRNETQSYRHRAHELEQQANHNKVLLDKIQTRNTRLERDSIELEGQLEAQKSQYDQLKEEYLGLLQSQRSSAEVEANNLAQIKEQLNLKASEVEEFKRKYAEQKSLVSELQAKQAVIEQDKPELEHSDEIPENFRALLSEKQLQVESLTAAVADFEEMQMALKDQLSAEKARADKDSSHLNRLKIETGSLEEQVKSAEFKLQEANQKIVSLSSQFEGMKRDVAELESSDASAEQLVDKIEKQELVFVAYHPGAGHISLPARQLEEYLEKPLTFAAQKCSVTLSQYKSWLLHYETTECTECNVSVKRIDAPSDFQAGIHDRCSKHHIDKDNITMFRQTS